MVLVVELAVRHDAGAARRVQRATGAPLPGVVVSVHNPAFTARPERGPFVARRGRGAPLARVGLGTF